MFLGHSRLEIRCRHVLGLALGLAPFHKQAVGQAAKDAQDEHGLGVLHPATVIVVGHLQSLMKPALDPPTLSIESQPFLRVEPLRRRAGDQGHFFVLSARGLPQESRGLGGKGKAHILDADLGAANGSILKSASIVVLRAGLCGCGCLEGENPLWER